MRDINNAEVRLVLSVNGVNRSTNRASFDPTRFCYTAELRPTNAGNYTVTARAALAGRNLGDDQQLLACEETDLEMADVRARPELMAQIARISGGKDLTAEPANPALLSSIFGKPAPPTVNYRHTPLWDKAWWLAAICSLLTLEWIVRRARGMA
jgi:hypothetical protein